MSKHTRSLEAEERRLQRREARKIVQRFALLDPVMSESVNRLTPQQIASELGVVFTEGVTFNFAARYERGEILTDSLGRGSLQRESCSKCGTYKVSRIIARDEIEYGCPKCDFHVDHTWGR